MLLAGGTTAYASVVCQGSGTTINFGVVDAQAGDTATGTIDFYCINYDQTPMVATVCVNIGNSMSGWGGGQPQTRFMTDGAGHNLQFELYKDSAKTQVWGSINLNSQPLIVQLPIPASGNGPGGWVTGRANASYPIYGRVPGNQASAVPGNYHGQFTSFDTFLSHAANGSQTCGQQDPGFSFNAVANVQAACTVTASDLDFGSVTGFLTSSRDGTSAINVNCPPGIAYKVGLDNGSNAAATQRQMKNIASNNYIGYELYRDTVRTQHWGNDTANGTNTVNGVGTGSTQNLAVYGRVPAQSPSPPAGNYSDTVTVTVAY
jgi:spore coat protein U-like protein